MEHKVFPLQLEEKSLENEPGTVTAIFATTGNEDSVGDIIQPGAFRKTLRERGNRIRVLWNHQFDQPPIGVIEDIKEQPMEDSDFQTALVAKVRFLDTPRAREVLEGIRQGAITEASIAFDLVKGKWKFENNKRIISELILWDISFVNWGANDKTFILQKAAVPFHSYGTDDESSWSAPRLSDFTDETFDALSDAEKKRIGNHFAWSANWPPEAYSDLKLPHHAPAKSGVGKAVWRGVYAAMAALMGARGGVDIPDSDRKDVYNHLSRHYEEFGKQPPDFKSVEEAFFLMQAYRIVSDENIRKSLMDEWWLRFDPQIYRRRKSILRGG